MEIILELIKDGLFPIACVIGMFYGIKYQFDKDREERRELEGRLDDLTKAQIEVANAVKLLAEKIGNSYGE